MALELNGLALQVSQWQVAPCMLSTVAYLDGNFTEGIHAHLHVCHLNAALQFTKPLSAVLILYTSCLRNATLPAFQGNMARCHWAAMPYLVRLDPDACIVVDDTFDSHKNLLHRPKVRANSRLPPTLHHSMNCRMSNRLCKAPASSFDVAGCNDMDK